MTAGRNHTAAGGRRGVRGRRDSRLLDPDLHVAAGGVLDDRQGAGAGLARLRLAAVVRAHPGIPSRATRSRRGR